MAGSQAQTAQTSPQAQGLRTDPFAAPIRLLQPPLIITSMVTVLLLCLGVFAIGRANVTATVTGPGMLLPAGTLIPAVAPEPGQVREVLVEPGEAITPGQPLVRVVTANGDSRSVAAPVAGNVVAVSALTGEVVDTWAPLVQIAQTGKPLQVTAFVAAAQAHEIQPGAQARVYPAGSTENDAAYVLGNVTRVEPLVASTQTVASVFGVSQADVMAAETVPRQAVVISFPGDPTTVDALPSQGTDNVVATVADNPRVTVRVEVGSGTVFTLLRST